MLLGRSTRRRIIIKRPAFRGRVEFEFANVCVVWIGKACVADWRSSTALPYRRRARLGLGLVGRSSYQTLAKHFKYEVVYILSTRPLSLLALQAAAGSRLALDFLLATV